MKYDAGMRSAALLALVAVTACDKVFEIGDPKQEDAATGTQLVTGSYKLRFTVNAADFTPMVGEEAYAASQLTMSVRLDDGSTPPVLVHDDGTFSFPRASATQAYSITVGSPVQTIEYQLATSQLLLVERSFGRPDPNPVTSPTPIQFALGSGVVPGSVIIGSTGMWTFTGTSEVNTGTFAFDWSTSSPVSSQLGLLRGDLNDRLYFIDVTGYTGYTAINAYSTFAVTQTNGMTSTVSGSAPSAATHDLCTHVVALRTEALSRLKTAIPDFTTSTEDDWFLFADPAATSVGPSGGPWVAAATEATPTAATDADLDASYINVFPGTTLLGSMGNVVYSTVHLGTATPLSIAAGGRLWRQPLTPGSTCVTSGVVLQSTIAIASKPSLGGVVLDTDDKVVSIDPTNPAAVTWTEAASGTVTHTVVVLFEITNDSGATGMHLVHRVVTLGTSVTLDPSLLVAGHTYMLSIVNAVEFPNATTGDFDTIAYPVANSTTLSRSFTVGG